MRIDRELVLVCLVVFYLGIMGLCFFFGSPSQTYFFWMGGVAFFALVMESFFPITRREEGKP